MSTSEHQKLKAARTGDGAWRRFGPYLSERQWGTVREDYSPGGTAWDSFPHDAARSRAYRWGEDGIGGFSDDQQLICLSVGLWNGNDPILKERLFGLAGPEGNHGEDVKELYYYLDATPSHSYLQMLYKYPHAAFPYERLVRENRSRGKSEPEFELLDTGLDPVRLVAAAPVALLEGGVLPRRPLVIASEYQRLTQDWIGLRALDASFLRSYGATEVFPPEDADLIVDNTATGATLAANNLAIVDELMASTTRLIAHPAALADPLRRGGIERLVMLCAAVLEARRRVMLEVNVSADRLDAVCAVLPCMREPTIGQLRGDAGYAVKAAVPRAEVALVIPLIKAAGGCDIVVSELSQIVP